MNDATPIGSIQRAKAVLDVLAAHPSGSASLSQVIAETEFSKTTAHRTLQSLQSVNYVYQDPETRRYCLGEALAQVARQACISNVAALSMRALRRLADMTEDTIFLSIPEGSVSICAHVEQGAFPIRTLTMKAGDRVPLGVGATGQALYAVMDARARKSVAEVNAGWLSEFNYTPDLLEELAEDFSQRGYALNPSIPVQGMSGIALPVQSEKGVLVAAVGVGAINDRMSADRIESELIPALRAEVSRLRTIFSQLEAEGHL